MAADDTPLDGPDEDAPGNPPGEAPRFSIHPLNPGKTNRYTDAVDALIDAQENAGEGETLAITLFLPGELKARNKHLREFREAAQARGKSARIKQEDEQADGSVAVDFTLSTRLTRDRKPATV